MAKKKLVEEHENLERWLVSYADFITLLFAFFTILYATGQTDKAKFQAAMESIQRSFMTGGGVFSLSGRPAAAGGSAGGVAGSAAGSDDSAEGGGTPDEGESGDAAKAKKIEEHVRDIFEKTTGLTAKSDDFDVMKSEEGFKIRLSEGVLFREGSAKLKKDSIPFIYEISKRLERLKLPIQVEGHTDTSEKKSEDGSPISPWQLSLNRASVFAQFLVEGAKFPKNKISITGYGDSQPLSDNNSPEGRSRNRRVEISIITPDKNIGTLNW